MNEITINGIARRLPRICMKTLFFQYFEKLPVLQLILIVFQILKVDIRIY